MKNASVPRAASRPGVVFTNGPGPPRLPDCVALIETTSNCGACARMAGTLAASAAATSIVRVNMTAGHSRADERLTQRRTQNQPYPCVAVCDRTVAFDA